MRSDVKRDLKALRSLEEYSIMNRADFLRLIFPESLSCTQNCIWKNTRVSIRGTRRFL
jgi:hypothetical protein